MKKEVLMCLAAATVAAVNAEVRTAGPFEQTAISVAEGQSETETGPIRHDSLASGFAKDGAGAYTLPLGTVVQTTPLELSVRQGSVKLTDDGTSATVSAPACLQNAALWLDANDLAGDSSAVQTWSDHRGADGHQSMSQNTEANRPTSVTDETSKKWLYFGGYGSGKYGTLSAKLNVINAFAIVKQVGGLGFLWGMNANYYVSFHAVLSANLGSAYWNGTESCNAVMAGQTYIDGKRVDGASETVKAGIQLIEWEAGEDPAPIMNFFNDRGIAGRFGGDYLGEVVFFTKRLSDTERQQVEMYLMQKWIGGVQPSQSEVKLASDSTVELDGSVTSPVTVRGNGTVEKSASESLYCGDANQGVSAAAWHLSNGGMTFEMGETKLALDSGESLVSSKDAYGVTTVGRTTDIEAGAAAIAGGSGAYRLEKLPTSTSNLTVTCGTFALGSKADPVDGVKISSTKADVYATMENPGFELFTSQVKNLNGMTQNGWTFALGAGAGKDCFWFVLKQGVDWWSSYGGATPIPEGAYALGFDFKNSPVGAVATASTSVTFTQDGDYELTFRDTPRLPDWGNLDNYDTYGRTRVDLTLVNDDGRKSVCNFYVKGYYRKDIYRRERYLVRNVKAGTYTFELKLTLTEDQAERLTLFDDFKFKLKEPETTETTYPVPNGDFEFHDYPNPKNFDTAVTATGWTFTNPELAADAMAAVGPLRNAIHGSVGQSGYDQYMELPWYLGAGVRYGQCQLAFFGNQGTATTAPFVPPAGKWRLRCQVARSASGMMKWNGAAINAQGSCKATVSVGGGAEQSLGTIDVFNAKFASATFPTAFSCDGTKSVVLTLKQTGEKGNLRVDDLELVRDDDLIANGNFGTGAGSKENWTTTSWTQMPNFLSDGNPYYGKTVIDGPALMISRQVSAEQEVEFSETGTYRLSFWARGRAHYASPTAELPVMNFAQNRLRFYLKKGGDETEIYRTEKLNSTNFVHYTALFPVTTAGTYTFGFQGTDTEDHNAWIDLVSVKKVSAAEAPDLPENATIKVKLADGEKLRLDYPGTATVRTLKVNGRSLHGTVSAATYPDYVTGPGSVNVTYRPGVLIVVK